MLKKTVSLLFVSSLLTISSHSATAGLITKVIEPINSSGNESLGNELSLSYPYPNFTNRNLSVREKSIKFSPVDLSYGTVVSAELSLNASSYNFLDIRAENYIYPNDNRRIAGILSSSNHIKLNTGSIRGDVFNDSFSGRYKFCSQVLSANSCRSKNPLITRNNNITISLTPDYLNALLDNTLSLDLFSDINYYRGLGVSGPTITADVKHGIAVKDLALKVTYETVEVSEPPIFALFGLGLVGLGLARRKS